MSNLIKNERGITLLGFIFFAIVVCVFGVLSMRIAPVYLQHYRVLHAMKALKELPKDDLTQSPQAVKHLLYSKLINQLYLNRIEVVKRKNIKINYKRTKYLIKVKYQVQTPLIYNIQLLFDFDSQAEVLTRDK